MARTFKFRFFFKYGNNLLDFRTERKAPEKK